tara:strand:+ start:22 stop:399 length:378 start_codon:yes stop_codon:yes gene_type:complete
MNYLFILILTSLSLALVAKDEIVYEVGTELKLERFSSVVLYHYKNDAININLNREFLDSPYRLMVDVRDLYKVKRGEKIKLLESFWEGKIFKVQLLTENPKRPYYFVELESLKHYSLIESKPSSG